MISAPGGPLGLGNEMRTVHFNELQEWQKDNEYIHTGYLPESNSMAAVARSLLAFHNESGNVYTHLVPAAFVAATLLCTVLAPPYVLFGTGCVLCLGMSATFHTLKSHSLRIATLGNKLDYLGICILIASSMIALVGYAFSDLPNQKMLFVSLTFALGSACATVTLLERFRSREFRPFRALMFVLYGLSGALPVVVGCYELGYAQTRERLCLNWLYAEAFLYIFGAFLYAARFPERTHPGRYDYIGHSHQIFHVFVVVAAYCHYRTLCGAERAMHLRSSLSL